MKIIIRLLIVALICVFPVLAQDDPVAEMRTQIEAATTDPDRIRLQLKLAELLVNTGHRSEALKELEVELAAHPQQAAALSTTESAPASQAESQPGPVPAKPKGESKPKPTSKPQAGRPHPASRSELGNKPPAKNTPATKGKKKRK